MSDQVVASRVVSILESMDDFLGAMADPSFNRGYAITPKGSDSAKNRRAFCEKMPMSNANLSCRSNTLVRKAALKPR